MQRRNFLFALCVTAALAVPLGGCDMLKEANAVREDVNKELGVQSGVNINVSNGHKTVTVKLSSTPSGDAADIKAKVEKIVKRHIKGVDEVKVEM